MRPRKKLLTLLVVVAVLVVLRIVVPLGLAWRHYETTPDFDAFVRAHPVDVAGLGIELGDAEVLATGPEWSVSSDDDASDEPTVETSNTITIRIDHGDDELLRFEQALVFEARADDWRRLGFMVRTPVLRTDPRMRAVVYTDLSAVDELVGEGSDGRGRATVDVFLLSGPGDSVVRIVEEADLDDWRGVGLTFPWWRFVFGIAHPLGSAPEEGIVYHVRGTVRFGWRKLENGSQGSGIIGPEIAVNTNQYSYGVEVAIAEEAPTGGGHSTSQTSSCAWTWNGRIW